ncbi:sugar phosphate isomerase/epimerase [Rhodococcus rhodochrous]|uniref:Sugar phosphate isomerase/epimerase n=1 Tax=Rhodococcus rhodochrous TaxID=1829 RepID=A0AAW4XQ12_RHORH|nr:sugar phosphate isomerase/epimerase [Rhodococcus rhodochrous]MCD2114879.1 sugar phosphate isomerase/epimerase [Rhodococcus rhodochrous]
MAVEVGYDAVGLRVFPVMETDVDVMSDPALQRAIQRRISQTGLSVFDVEVVRISAHTDIAEILPALDFAGELGARWFAVTSTTPEEYAIEDESLLLQQLAALTEVASRRNVGVMLEFMAYRGIASIQAAARIVSAVDHPDLRITVDALHFFRSGGTAADLANIPPEQLACVQLCDAPATPSLALPQEARFGRSFPGEGDLPLGELLAALPEDLWACVEVPSGRRPQESALSLARTGYELTQQLFARTHDSRVR